MQKDPKDDLSSLVIATVSMIFGGLLVGVIVVICAPELALYEGDLVSACYVADNWPDI